jgi:hypothetical protein
MIVRGPALDAVLCKVVVKTGDSTEKRVVAADRREREKIEDDVCVEGNQKETIEDERASQDPELLELLTAKVVCEGAFELPKVPDGFMARAI